MKLNKFVTEIDMGSGRKKTVEETYEHFRNGRQVNSGYFESHNAKF